MMGLEVPRDLIQRRYPDGVVRYAADRVPLFRRTCCDGEPKVHALIDLYISPPLRELSISPLALRSLEVENAGGRSAISEMLSIDYFCRVHDAKDVTLEMEVEYWIDYKMVDYVCVVDDIRVGVSVTRAMGFPTADDFTPEQAEDLLSRKINGLIVARNAVVKRQRFFRSVLHIWCQSSSVARLVRDAYVNNNRSFDDVRGTLTLLMTVCDRPEIYRDSWNPSPPKKIPRPRI